ncbi:hypothetical protein pb186bvf_015035 [Paramecium bursaria]
MFIFFLNQQEKSNLVMCTILFFFNSGHFALGYDGWSTMKDYSFLLHLQNQNQNFMINKINRDTFSNLSKNHKRLDYISIFQFYQANQLPPQQLNKKFSQQFMKRYQAERCCQIQGHQNFDPTHICTFQECEHKSRWACNQCFVSGAHNHSQNNNIHLMNQEQFINYISQLDNQKNKNILEQALQYYQPLNQLIEAIKQLEMFWQDSVSDMDYSIQKEICRQANFDFYSINDAQITKILNKLKSNTLQFEFQSFFKNIQEIRIQLQEIEESIIQDINSIEQNIHNQSFEFVDYAKFELNGLILTSQISQNEQYLVYGGRNKQLVIYDLYAKKTIQKYKLDDIITVCRFSQDSSLLLTGFENGYLNCLELNNIYEQIYHQQIHNDIICNIVVQSNQVIITSDKIDILVTDIYNKQQLLKIGNVHSDLINGLDFILQNDVLVSGSFDKSIKFFNLQTGQLQIQKQFAHDNPILKIQLHNNRLLSLSQEGVLKLWHVDFKSMKLKWLQTMTDQNSIKSFDFVNDKMIIIMCNKHFKLLDEELEVQKVYITQIDHVEFNKTNQLKSMSYLIFTGACNIYQYLISLIHCNDENSFRKLKQDHSFDIYIKTVHGNSYNKLLISQIQIVYVLEYLLNVCVQCYQILN